MTKNDTISRLGEELEAVFVIWDPSDLAVLDFWKNDRSKCHFDKNGVILTKTIFTHLHYKYGCSAISNQLGTL